MTKQKRAENVCEHGDHPAPPGRRYCSDACQECDYTEHYDPETECANVCGKRKP
jgi:hypothetical protein